MASLLARDAPPRPPLARLGGVGAVRARASRSDVMPAGRRAAHRSPRPSPPCARWHRPPTFWQTGGAQTVVEGTRGAVVVEVAPARGHYASRYAAAPQPRLGTPRRRNRRWLLPARTGSHRVSSVRLQVQVTTVSREACRGGGCSARASVCALQMHPSASVNSQGLVRAASRSARCRAGIVELCVVVSGSERLSRSLSGTYLRQTRAVASRTYRGSMRTA